MGLNDEERTALVAYRLQKAKDTLAETRDIVAAGAWYAAATGFITPVIMPSARC